MREQNKLDLVQLNHIKTTRSSITFINLLVDEKISLIYGRPEKNPEIRKKIRKSRKKSGNPEKKLRICFIKLHNKNLHNNYIVYNIYK